MRAHQWARRASLEADCRFPDNMRSVALQDRYAQGSAGALDIDVRDRRIIVPTVLRSIHD